MSSAPIFGTHRHVGLLPEYPCHGGPEIRAGGTAAGRLEPIGDRLFGWIRRGGKVYTDTG